MVLFFAISFPFFLFLFLSVLCPLSFILYSSSFYIKAEKAIGETV